MSISSGYVIKYNVKVGKPSGKSYFFHTLAKLTSQNKIQAFC